LPGNHNEIEKRLWAAADELRANSKLKASEYSSPVLGLIFLKYADFKFRQAEKELKGKGSERRPVGKLDYQARGVLYLPEEARFSNLVRLPEGTDIGNAINQATSAIEADNEELRGVLPERSYTKLDNSTLRTLLKIFNIDQTTLDGESLLQGDAFGRIFILLLKDICRY
jgi:type I restriction enzyme M protein